MSGTEAARADLPLLERLRSTLPLSASSLRVRRLTRPDLACLAAWPDYPFPYRGFVFSFRSMRSQELDALCTTRRADPSRFSLVIDHVSQPCVGYLALLDIDWAAKRIGNLAVRVHPEWCDRGVGTDALQAVLRWVVEAGMEAVHLDVAASNPRATPCYEKVGFKPIAEVWR